jgi:hypothetical protein
MQFPLSDSMTSRAWLYRSIHCVKTNYRPVSDAIIREDATPPHAPAEKPLEGGALRRWLGLREGDLLRHSHLSPLMSIHVSPVHAEWVFRAGANG